MEKIGFYAGSFDPFTRGHLAVICKALCRFDVVIVGIGRNPDKQGLFSPEERKKLIRLALDDFKYSYRNRVLNGMSFSLTEEGALYRLEHHEDCLKIIVYSDLTVDAALRFGATALIRGERSVGDRESEMKLSATNRELLAVRHRHLDTDMIPVPKIELANVSSSAVKGLFAAGEYVAAMKYVTPSVHQALSERYLKKRYTSLFDKEWDKLQQAYSYRRVYHTLSHVAYCLNYVDIFCNTSDPEKIKSVLEMRDCLSKALFWHDFCVEQTNAEELSAAAAVKAVASPEEHKYVRELIMATRHDGKQHDYNEACRVMHDVDLAILGDTENYGIYAMQVCKEYAPCCPAAIYVRDRIDVLQHFISSKPRLYQTDFFAEMFEESAEKNLRRELNYWLCLR